jgi:hypothetical protein
LKNINDLDIIRGEKNTLKNKGYDKNDEATIHTRVQSKNTLPIKKHIIDIDRMDYDTENNMFYRLVIDKSL